jgi:hypothetical protein
VNGYLISAEAAANAATHADVEAIAKTHLKALEKGFLHLAGHFPTERSDAQREFEDRFEDLLEQHAFWTTVAFGEGEGNAVFARFTFDQFSQFATTLRSLLMRLASGVPDPEKRGGFDQGESFNALLLRIHDWARKHNFPLTWKLKDTGAPGWIAEFTYALNRLIEPAARRVICNSPVAMAKRGADVLAAHRKRQRQSENGNNTGE